MMKLFKKLLAVAMVAVLALTVPLASSASSKGESIPTLFILLSIRCQLNFHYFTAR